VRPHPLPPRGEPPGRPLRDSGRGAGGGSGRGARRLSPTGEAAPPGPPHRGGRADRVHSRCGAKDGGNQRGLPNHPCARRGRMKPLHFAFLMLINVAWGFNIVPVKLALNDMEPFLAAAMRFIFLFMMCAPFIRWVPGRMKLLGTAALMTGAVQFSLMNLAFVSARNMSALAIVGQLSVPFSLVLAVLFLGERIRWRRTLGVILAFGGVAVLGFDPNMLSE